MPRVSYEPATRDAIVKAAVGARSENKTWNEAHAAAKAAGYQGGLQGIIKLISTSEKNSPVAAATGGSEGSNGADAAPVERKRGRPKGSRNRKKRGRPAKVVAAKTATMTAAAPSGASDGFGMQVEKLLKSRINSALEDAVRALQNAML